MKNKLLKPILAFMLLQSVNVMADGVDDVNFYRDFESKPHCYDAHFKYICDNRDQHNRYNWRERLDREREHKQVVSVPETSTLSLLIAGMLMVAIKNRRNK